MKDWYLITSDTRPNMLGGFENEAHIDCKKDAFVESLYTDIGTTVTLFNYDLSEQKVIRCIIQDNIANTMLKSIERSGLFEIGTVKAGMYVFFENRYWLITGYPGNNGVYEKATMVLCQYKLRWQNERGKIIERWCNITSASKYDVGESGNKVIFLASNNYTLLMPDDKETLLLDGKRVFIDKNKDNPTKVFKITRNDDVLYDYGDEHGGLLSFIADKGELNKNTDNQKLGICDYFEQGKKPQTPKDDSCIYNYYSLISGRTDITLGYLRTYSVVFKNEKKEIVPFSEVEFSWNIISDFTDSILTNFVDNKIEITIDDKKCIGKSFKLQVIVNDNVNSEITVAVNDIYY